jgi:hypothetical protein
MDLIIPKQGPLEWRVLDYLAHLVVMELALLRLTKTCHPT